MKTVIRIKRQGFFKILILGIALGLASNAYSQTVTNIGDIVWRDVDANGIQDGGEVGVDGTVDVVTVRLLSFPAKTELASTTIDASGNYTLSYTITNSQNFFVEFSLPANYSYTGQNLGGNDALDSDPSISTGSVFINVIEGVDITNLDAGMYKKGTMNGHLYKDDNNNSTQDAGEPDMATVEISIQDKDGVSTTVYTDANGDWTAQITPGSTTYDIIESSSSYFLYGYTHTEGAGSFSYTVPEGATTSPDPINDGFYLKSFIGNYAWRDSDMDGIQDGGEPKLSGVVIWLIADDFSRVESATTEIGRAHV